MYSFIFQFKLSIFKHSKDEICYCHGHYCYYICAAVNVVNAVNEHISE